MFSKLAKELNARFKLDLKRKLMLCSAALAVSAIVLIYLVSRGLISDMIVNGYRESQNNSFTQVGKYFQSIFETSQFYMNKISGNAPITASITNAFDSRDAVDAETNQNNVDKELNNIFINPDYIEKIILLGFNDFAYVYSPTDKKSYVESDFNFLDFHNNTSLFPFSRNEGIPFYYSNKDRKVAFNNAAEKDIQSAVNNRIIFVRALKNQSNATLGLLIVVFNDDMLNDIMFTVNNEQSLYLIDDKQSVIWSSAGAKAYSPMSESGMKDASLVRPSQDGQQVVAKYQLYAYNLKLVSTIPMRVLLNYSLENDLFTLLFGLALILLEVFLSPRLSSGISGSVKQLLDNIIRTVPEAVPEVDPIPKRNPSLRTRLMIYFGITILVPCLVYMLLLSAFYYNIYKEDIESSTQNTLMQVKQNIDCNFGSYDIMTKYFANDASVQDLLAQSGNQGDVGTQLDGLFLEMKAIKRDFLALSLYNKFNQSVYSSIYADSFISTDTLKNFSFIKGTNSDSQSIIGLMSDLSMNPVVAYTRPVAPVGPEKNKDNMGYMIFYTDEDMLGEIYRNIRLGDSGYFFLTDMNQNVFINDNESLTTSIIKSTTKFYDNLSNKTGAFSVNYGGRSYILLYNTLGSFNLKLVGLIPSSEIQAKLAPFFEYSLILIFSFALFTLAISALISSSITKPVRMLLKQLDNSIRIGNFDFAERRGNDEITLLYNHFNYIVKQMNELIRENYQAKLHENELMFLEKEAQLNALQQQINPHFLYNTLESIKWIAYKRGVTEICEMSTALGKFFRGSIAKTKELVTCAEEIELLQNYLYIQQLRYRGKFDVVWNIQEEVGRCKMIKLVLQPLVENAIIHGIDNMETGGVITIAGFIAGESAVFEVSDNGFGMTEEQLNALTASLAAGNGDSGRTSIGLNNVYSRLKLYFADKCSFTISSVKGSGTTVRFSIPYEL